MGREARSNLFSKGRDEGLEVALRIVENGGTAEDIRREIRFRDISGISIGLTNRELDIATTQVKDLMTGSMRIALAASIADSYGFGQKRIQRVLDNFDKLTEYLDNGWLYWLDVVEELKRRYGFSLELSEHTVRPRHYSRPDPADIWEEPDFVRKEDWEYILSACGFTQGVSVDGHPCVFDGSEPLIEYEDKYQQIDAYDMLLGVLLERSMHPKETAPKEHAVPESKARKRKRRRKQ